MYGLWFEHAAVAVKVYGFSGEIFIVRCPGLSAWLIGLRLDCFDGFGFGSLGSPKRNDAPGPSYEKSCWRGLEFRDCPQGSLLLGYRGLQPLLLGTRISDDDVKTRTRSAEATGSSYHVEVSDFAVNIPHCSASVLLTTVQ